MNKQLLILGIIVMLLTVGLSGCIETNYNTQSDLLVTETNYDNSSDRVITRKTNYKYEYGMKVVEDNQIIENYIFIDIPIGIVIWSSNNTIANCTFINCTDEGILLIGDNNTIRDSVFYNCCDGIELQRSSNNAFINDRFLHNSHAGIDGIIENNNNNLFSFCVFYNNPYAVYFKESENNQFENCTFLDNGKDIIEVS